MTDNRRQHTVPKFYLKRFTESNERTIYQYDKDENNGSVRTSIGNIAVRKNFYSRESLREFENRYAISVDNLVKSKNYYGLTDTDQENVRLFVWHMYVRSEQTRKDIDPIVKQLNAYAGTDMPIDPRRFQTDSIKDECKFEQTHFTIMENMTNAPFWTSDNPVANFVTELHLPLTPKMCLVLLDSKLFKKIERVQLMQDEHVAYQNLIQLCNASRFAYSHSKEFRGIWAMIKNAKNCRKKTSRYDSANLLHAATAKPKLENTQPYEFELLNPNKRNWLKDVQDGSRYSNHPQDYVVDQMLRVRFGLDPRSNFRFVRTHKN